MPEADPFLPPARQTLPKEEEQLSFRSSSTPPDPDRRGIVHSRLKTIKNTFYNLSLLSLANVSKYSVLILDMIVKAKQLDNEFSNDLSEVLVD
ncbi:hypothetical protein TNCV_2093471 [Trichonephila clavipes]|nr:hypothetical protein TNCV_2093471 [Trichonephila clavipes]